MADPGGQYSLCSRMQIALVKSGFSLEIVGFDFEKDGFTSNTTKTQDQIETANAKSFVCACLPHVCFHVCDLRFVLFLQTFWCPTAKAEFF
jgi:hypothetical protein